MDRLCGVRVYVGHQCRGRSLLGVYEETNYAEWLSSRRKKYESDSRFHVLSSKVSLKILKHALQVKGELRYTKMHFLYILCCLTYLIFSKRRIILIEGVSSAKTFSKTMTLANQSEQLSKRNRVSSWSWKCDYTYKHWSENWQACKKSKILKLI